MSSFIGNLLITAVWVLITGEVTVLNILFGFMVGYLVLYLGADVVGARRYLQRVSDVLELVGFLFWELTRANLQVAYDVVTPTFHMNPAIVRMELEGDRDIEVLLLTIMITVTPGEILLEVSPDRRWIYIHAMYVKDVERYRRRIKQKFERRLLEVTR